MNDYTKIEEALKGYISEMNKLNYATEKELIYATLGDIKNIAQNFNKRSDIRIKSIIASEGPIIAFGVISSYLINGCKKASREDLLEKYRIELERIFGVYSKDKRFIDSSVINKKLKEHGKIDMEYSEPIMNMFLNTASILACKILLGAYITEQEEGLKFIENYLVENYLNKKDVSETKHIVIE